MARNHLLLDKALIYEGGRQLKDPEGYEYDNVLGAWISQTDRVFLVESDKRPRPVTKKADIETGEDLKGE